MLKCLIFFSPEKLLSQKSSNETVEPISVEKCADWIIIVLSLLLVGALIAVMFLLHKLRNKTKGSLSFITSYMSTILNSAA